MPHAPPVLAHPPLTASTGNLYATAREHPQAKLCATGTNLLLNKGMQTVDAEKLAEYQVTVRNGQAIGIEALVKNGYLSPAEAEVQLKLLVAQGSPYAEEVLLRITRHVVH